MALSDITPDNESRDFIRSIIAQDIAQRAAAKRPINPGFPT